MHMAILKKKPAADKDEKAVPADEKKAAKKEIKRGPLAKEHGGASSHRVLIKPVLSEKSGRQESMGKYTFMVAKDTNKVEVARAIRELYGVKPVSVRIVLKKGKAVHFGRAKGYEKDEKKAIVTLRAGESITVSEA